MIVIISPNRFPNIFSYINKVSIKHICYVLRALMDKIMLNYLLYNVSYLTIFCVNDDIDDTPILRFFIFMSIMNIFSSSNLASDKIFEMSITILRNFISKVEYKIILSFLNIWYYFVGNPRPFLVFVWECFSVDRTTQLVCIVNSVS